MDVSLCGSIPRSEMHAHYSSHWPRLERNTDQPSPASNFKTDRLVSMAATSLARKVSDDQVVSNTQVIEPPSWAVPAKGEAILEVSLVASFSCIGQKYILLNFYVIYFYLQPISDTGILHKPVDLTKRSVFRIGRSEVSDMQLLHCASSRRHAILFHHPNGSCYIVDCGSAHGTFVNGVRVRSSVTENGVVPQKVKKGALLRFGGPGAPTFILKSFSVGFDSLLKNLHDSYIVMQPSNVIVDEPPPNTPDEEISMSALDALVTLNTRLNSVGYVSRVPPLKNGSSLLFSDMHAPSNHSSNVSFLRRRHAVSFDEDAYEEPASKRLKSVGSIESTSSIDSDDSIPMVSPSCQKPVLSFTFGDDHRPVVSPNPFEDCSRTVKTGLGAPTSILSVSLSLPSTNKKKTKSVNFCADPPDVF